MCALNRCPWYSTSYISITGFGPTNYNSIEKTGLFSCAKRIRDKPRFTDRSNSHRFILRFSPFMRNSRSVRPATVTITHPLLTPHLPHPKNSSVSWVILCLRFAALSHDDRGHRVHPVHPYASTVHARRRSGPRSHHIHHDIRNRHSDVRAGHVRLQVYIVYEQFEQLMNRHFTLIIHHNIKSCRNITIHSR